MTKTASKPSKLKMPPHPGDVLNERLQELGVSPYRFGEATGAKAVSAYSLIREHARFGGRNRRNLTAQMALRLGKFFGDDPAYWLGLQTQYDLALALSDSKFAAELANIEKFSPQPSKDMLTGEVPAPRKKRTQAAASAKSTPAKKSAKKTAPKKAASATKARK